MAKRVMAAYVDQWSLRPGDETAVRVSSDTPGLYSADVVRLHGCDTLGTPPTFSEVKSNFEVPSGLAAASHPTTPGSFLKSTGALTLNGLSTITITTFVFYRAGTTSGGTVLDAGRGAVRLVINPDGQLVFNVGGYIAAPHRAVPRGRWALVWAGWRSEDMKLSSGWRTCSRTPGLDFAECIGTGKFAGPTITFDEMIIGASLTHAGATAHGFTGKIESPAIHDSYLDHSSILAICHSRDVGPEPGALRAWDFSVGIPTSSVQETGRDVRSSELIQGPTRAVTGRLWDGRTHHWQQRPEHYAAIHFHADDLLDAGWPEAFRLTVPEQQPSGVYAIRLLGLGATVYIPFFVLPPKGKSCSSVAFLAPTATYLAYANHTAFLLEPDAFPQFRHDEETRELLLAHDDFGKSLYGRHADGSGVTLSSALRPILNLSPRTTQWGFTADGDILAWANSVDQELDVVTDDVLHNEGVSLLSPYRVVVTGTHPEYYSEEMRGALAAYIQNGGRVMYLGGNGFYWRISFLSDRPLTIEVRRGADGTRSWSSEPGEHHHQSDGRLGGLWRRLGRPPQELVGVGFSAQGFASGSYYRRSPSWDNPRIAFAVDGVLEEQVGRYGSHCGGAAGEEIDRADESMGTPAHAICIASAKFDDENMLRAIEELQYAVSTKGSDPDVRADMVFFETPNGGAVFSVGSVSWASSLSYNGYDNSIARITRNVLSRFLDERPFDMPD